MFVLCTYVDNIHSHSLYTLSYTRTPSYTPTRTRVHCWPLLEYSNERNRREVNLMNVTFAKLVNFHDVKDVHDRYLIFRILILILTVSRVDTRLHERSEED